MNSKRRYLAITCLLAVLAPLNDAHAQFTLFSNTATGGGLTVRSTESGQFGDFIGSGTTYVTPHGPPSFMYFSDVLILPDSGDPRVGHLANRPTSDTGVQNGVRRTTFSVRYSQAASTNLTVDLMQQILPTSPVFIQTYTLRNQTPSPMGFRLILLQDVDLIVDGIAWTNKAKVTHGSAFTVSNPDGVGVLTRLASGDGTYDGFAVYRGQIPVGFGQNLNRYLFGGIGHAPGFAADELNVFHSGSTPTITKLLPNDDANHDMTTDGFGDISVASQWRFDLPPGASANWTVITSIVPEPGTSSLLMTAVVVCRVRKRRRVAPTFGRQSRCH